MGETLEFAAVVGVVLTTTVQIDRALDCSTGRRLATTALAGVPDP